MAVEDIVLTEFVPGINYEFLRVEPDTEILAFPTTSSLEDELAFHLSVGAFAFAGITGEDQVYWTGEDNILDAVQSGEFDYVNPSWSHTEGDQRRQRIFELVRFDDRDFALRIANSCLAAAGREKRLSR